VNYSLINSISGDIRNILDISRQVNMVALNATLVARQAGDAHGFSAVAGELRGFSQHLNQDMENLSRQVYLLSMEVSCYFKQHHRLRLFELSKKSCDSLAVLNSSTEHLQLQQQSSLDEFKTRLQQLQLKVTKSLRLCNTGRALARSSMIEAHHSRTNANKLSVVAAEIESTINSIYGWLKAIVSKITNTAT